MGRAGAAAGLALLAAGCATAAPPRASVIRELPAGGCAPMSWPADGVVSSPFGPRDGRAHDGIDLALPSGTPVRAACDGVVAYAGERLRGYGRLVLVRHNDGLMTIYAHNALLRVREGERVARGQVLALSGQSGRATAPHLHFEVRRGTRPTDPLEYLPPRPPAAQARRARWTPASPR
jgi:murein DD-endopeptidase MepM/ murein hydrolase activator NlpD